MSWCQLVHSHPFGSDGRPNEFGIRRSKSLRNPSSNDSNPRVKALRSNHPPSPTCCGAAHLRVPFFPGPQSPPPSPSALAFALPSLSGAAIVSSKTTSSAELPFPRGTRRSSPALAEIPFTRSRGSVIREKREPHLDCLPFQNFHNCIPMCATTCSFAKTGYYRAPSRRFLATKKTELPLAMSGDASSSAPLQGQAAKDGGDRAGSVKQQLSRLFKASLSATVPDEPNIEPLVEVCTAKFGDYQCNNAMGLWSRIKGKSTEFKNPNSVGQAIARNLPPSDIIESTSVAGPGFVNIVLSDKWVAQSIQQMLLSGIGTWAPILSVPKAVVDFSSPNIAKEMHVGHLRSTIIGDTLARMLEFSNVEVLRRNHVGDWGTQFGMLIEHLFDKFPNWEEAGEQAIGDLQEFYKASKRRFDDDSTFMEKAQKAVVRLQGGEARYRDAWKKICEISRKEFDLVYQCLGVHLEEKGESFYNPYIPGVLEELSNKGLIEESDGARVIFIEGHQIPLIVVKRDGGYNYASTDLAALWYRLNIEKANWIIYVTDVGQSQHFDMFFSAARRAGWLPDSNGNLYPKASHVGFGLVLGSDGKRFRTRSSEVVRLVELLDEAKSRSKTELQKRLKENGKIAEWTDEELEKTAEAIGYGAVKYADLKNNRLTNYTFSFDQMLNDKGNTAVYLLYAHARICSIIRKSGRDVEELKKTGNIVLGEPDERILGLHLIKFAEVVEEACTNLLPNILCEYLYNLSEKFTGFYSRCPVVGSAEETSRLLLCEATAVVMRKCFYLLGITPVYKI
ncbi:arginine--tRNA ligase, cytoplasmic-like isoform X2 [Phoenix dactylifera]|uniref:arginine--tRNA ligase n=1 Tax=Phoenix dactylifera TaxID=42345 RepID=A0A8B8ZDG1_PHODC|nr:arginine--tRNA ligase, cytoplasmic-like isoform X2 [Phoenix dactylifera]